MLMLLLYPDKEGMLGRQEMLLSKIFLRKELLPCIYILNYQL
jgi:hypothetical protein